MLKHALHKHVSAELNRNRLVIEARKDAEVVVAGEPALNFCSNDYLNLTQHPEVIKAFVNGVNKYGMGSGASAMVAGYYKPTKQLEDAFCEFLNRESALFFNSGYHANLGIITALAKLRPIIIADKLCHASLIDGIILSRAKYFRYPHNDILRAQILLQKHRNALLISESIFSMQGNIAAIKQLSEYALQHKALLIVDDAHGIGVLGDGGKGICEHFNLSQSDLPCLTIPLGKSFGSMGAVVTGNKDLIEYLLQFSRTYTYTTALPPAIAYATLKTLHIIQNENWRREKLNGLCELFTKEAQARNLPLISYDQTPIKTIMIGSNKITLRIQYELLKSGYFVSCIRPPTVPAKTARIRISLNCMHTEDQIFNLLDQLEKLYNTYTTESEINDA